MNIGKKILELRKENEVTQEQLGKILSVGKTTISNYENEYSTPDAENIAKIAKYFHVSADYILGLTNKKEKDIHNNSNENVTTRNNLEKIIQDYVINKELFQPDSDSYEDLKKIMAEIISNNENIILEILNNRRNLNEMKGNDIMSKHQIIKNVYVKDCN